MIINSAIAYVRVSTKEQSGEGISLAAQEERIQAYCGVAGLRLIGLIREEGVSASVVLSRRPCGIELVRRIHACKAVHVVATKLDRLFRDAADALFHTKEWNRTGTTLHLVDSGGQPINTATAIGRMFLSMLACFAELERNQVSERTAAALSYKKSRGEVYGPIPLGFVATGEGKLCVSAREMAIVRAIYDARTAGHSLRGIARALNRAGYLGKNRGRFYASTVRRILNNPIYIPENDTALFSTPPSAGNREADSDNARLCELAGWRATSLVTYGRIGCLCLHASSVSPKAVTHDLTAWSPTPNLLAPNQTEIRHKPDAKKT